MRIFRPTRKGPRGATIPYRRWHVSVVDHRGYVRKFAAYPDQENSRALGVMLERLVAHRSTRRELTPELVRWLEGLPEPMRARLVELDLVNADQFAGSRPLEQVIAGFKQSLLARERTQKHVGLTIGRIERTFEACAFGTWSKIDALKLERHLAEARANGTSSKESNHVLAACKQFTRWAVEHGLATADPLLSLRPQNAELDRRRIRRALSWGDELPRLIRAAQNGPEQAGMSGPLRALVWRLLAESGLRVGELVAVRVADVDLEEGRPSLVVRATSAKNRREARLPLRPETAQDLEPYTQAKHPSAPLLPLPKSFRAHAVRWLRPDLERAKIPFVDEAGQVFDVHALRVSCVTALVRSGADVRTVQALARHATPHLTLSTYAKVGRDDERNAIAGLPSLKPDDSAQEANSATGTDTAPNRVASSVAFPLRSSDPRLHPLTHSTRKDGPKKAVAGSARVGEAGFEPDTKPATELPQTSASTEGYDDSAIEEHEARGAQCGVSPSFVGSDEPDLARLVEVLRDFTPAQRAALLRAAGLQPPSPFDQGEEH